MKHSACKRCALFVFILTALAGLLVSGCETMQPGMDLASTISIGAGPFSSTQAGSLIKSATAVGKTFQDITPEQEYYIGRTVAATVFTKYRAYDDPEANHYLNVVGQTLAQASDRPETFGGYHFLLLDSPEINAFSAPGGLILVTRGMMRCCKSEDALAAVLAHEIGHVQGQHGLRAIKRGRLTSALTILAGEGLKTFGGAEIARLTELFEGSVGDIAKTLMNNGYSRELEREADQSAVTILTRVGYDPHALPDMLQEMDKQLKPGGLDFAKTHPDPQDRIQEVAGMVRTAPVAPAPPARQERFALAMGEI